LGGSFNNDGKVCKFIGVPEILEKTCLGSLYGNRLVYSLENGCKRFLNKLEINGKKFSCDDQRFSINFQEPEQYSQNNPDYEFGLVKAPKHKTTISTYEIGYINSEINLGTKILHLSKQYYLLKIARLEKISCAEKYYDDDNKRCYISPLLKVNIAIMGITQIQAKTICKGMGVVSVVGKTDFGFFCSIATIDSHILLGLVITAFLNESSDGKVNLILSNRNSYQEKKSIINIEIGGANYYLFK
jgi:hypothetical protein